MWGESLDQDLVRRDFTINAIALKPIWDGTKFEIIDLQGGIRDLKNKIDRVITPVIINILATLPRTNKVLPVFSS